MPRTKLPKGSASLTFRLPLQIKNSLVKRARREQLSLAEFIRRTLRRELEGARGRNSRHER